MEQAQAVERSNKVVAGVGAVRDFLVAVRAEMGKVTWPTREELFDATKRVVLMTLLIGTAIGILDRVLQYLLLDSVAALSR